MVEKNDVEMNDQDRFELLERRLAERVTQRVRSQLFLLYATAGSAVIFVLGFVGWNMLSGIKTEIKDGIEKEIKAKQVEIVDQVTETAIIAKRAKQVIERLEDQLDAFEPHAEDLEKTIEKVDALKITAQDLVASEVDPLLDSVESLSEQLEVLAKQVSYLNTVVDGESASDGEAGMSLSRRTSAIKGVISDAAKTKQDLVEARERITVFFQFAGAPRNQVEELSKALQETGYLIPGEEREVGAMGKHEVRYFHTKDKDAAERLATHTNMVLRGMGYANTDALTVQAESFVSFRGRKPREGVVELWLELPRLRDVD